MHYPSVVVIVRSRRLLLCSDMALGRALSCFVLLSVASARELGYSETGVFDLSAFGAHPVPSMGLAPSLYSHIFVSTTFPRWDGVQESYCIVIAYAGRVVFLAPEFY